MFTAVGGEQYKLLQAELLLFEELDITVAEVLVVALGHRPGRRRITRKSDPCLS